MANENKYEKVGIRLKHSCATEFSTRRMLNIFLQFLVS